ncbi:MAG TPA: AIPR family protein [Terriglobales bacterium]|nr:AIPR family protein [Terriglobales bacterium]
MGTSVHRFRAFEMRKITHPVFTSIDKYWMTVAAKDFPAGISTSVNARDPVGLNRRVYQDVRSSLDGTTAIPGSFDLMNKGITILAKSVRLVDKEKGLFDVTIDNEEGGIVDGAHTAEIIQTANDEGTTPDEQHVEVYIRTNVGEDLISDIARGLNTGIQVAAQSIYNIAGVFDWLKEEIKGQRYEKRISWRESDDEDYDVRDLISVLEVFNVFDFPNEMTVSKHPYSAYEKWSAPLKKFADDFNENKDDLSRSKYYRLRNLLKDGLTLYDYIRHDFRDMHNEDGGRTGRMNLIEEASARRGTFDFPFAGLSNSQYRLTKGATFPILAAFRTYVEVNPRTGEAKWRGGFGKILDIWKDAGPSLVEETYQLTQEGIRNPDAIGKNRKHWSNLYMRLQVRLLQERLQEEQVKAAGRRRNS